PELPRRRWHRARCRRRSSPLSRLIARDPPFAGADPLRPPTPMPALPAEPALPSMPALPPAGPKSVSLVWVQPPTRAVTTADANETKTRALVPNPSPSRQRGRAVVRLAAEEPISAPVARSHRPPDFSMSRIEARSEIETHRALRS